MSDVVAVPRVWPWPLRLAFRFVVSYCALYVLTSQMVRAMWPFPVLAPNLDLAMRPLVGWVGQQFFGAIVSFAPTGSGDRLSDWLAALCVLVIAAGACALWSLLDRKRPHYEALDRAFRVFLRMAVGATLVGYGMAKVIPLQMPAPQLTRLLEPFGNFSPMGVLWYSIGASFPYERFVGSVELVAGVLLFIPQTQLLGALLALLASVEIFVLNMTYDVPVKLFSWHLVLMSSVLMAPHALRLVRALTITGPRTHLATAAQVGFGLYLVAAAAVQSSSLWSMRGPGAPKPVLYGIWNIERMHIDGVERLPLATDYDRWRRLVVDDTPRLAFWRMDDTPLALTATIDDQARTIVLKNGTEAAGTLRYERPEPDRLLVEGAVQGRAVRLDTRRVDHTAFRLVSRGFHWVQEAPFNR